MLTQLREARGMTIPDVVRALDVPRATAYSWEQPGARPEPAALQRLLDLYNATDEQRLEAWRLRSLPPEPADAPTEAA